MATASRTSFWIEDATREGVELLAARDGCSRGAVIRAAIHDRIIREAEALTHDERRAGGGAVETPTDEQGGRSSERKPYSRT
jgi:hypothetical protein